MSTLAVTHPTLLDVTKRLDPEGRIDKIVEILNQVNEVLEDAVWLEANQMTGHRTTVRTGLPTPTWRKLYGGVAPTKSTTAQVTESMGMLEAYAEVDKALADLNGNTAAFRMSEEIPHIEGMGEEMAASLFFADESTAPEEITGFAPRFNAKSGATNGENIINSGSTPDASDNSSIWLVGWGPNTVHCLYPKGSKAGLQVTDKGQVTLETAVGGTGRMEAYRTHFRWDAGLCVRDWRYVVRIQINQEDLTKDAASGDDLIDLMTQAVELVPSLSNARFAFYMNRTIRSYLRRQLVNKVKNSTLTVEQVAGKHVTMFNGIPVRRCDALTNTESGIS